jgi:hypothetical protein
MAQPTDANDTGSPGTSFVVLPNLKSIYIFSLDSLSELLLSDIMLPAFLLVELSLGISICGNILLSP